LESNLKLVDVGKRLRLLDDNLIFHKVGAEEKVREGAITYCSDTVEALNGAIFIDSNYDLRHTKDCISKIFASELQEMEKQYRSNPA
jgi:dsRNA-specific ribonuclease